MYNIFSFNGQIPWDSVPVLKTSIYPFTSGAYKPYGLTSICRSGNDLVVRILDFCILSKDISDSNMAYLSISDGKHGLLLSISQSGICKISGCDDVNIISSNKYILAARWFEGNDNLGVYWGSDIIIPGDIITKLLGYSPSSSGKLYCNFITSCTDENHFHYGCTFEPSINSPSPYNPSKDFTVMTI